MRSNGSRKSSDRSRGRSNFVCTGGGEEVCRDYLWGHCTRGECKFAHPAGREGKLRLQQRSASGRHKAASRASGGRRGAGGVGGGLAAASGAASAGDCHVAASRAGGGRRGGQKTAVSDRDKWIMGLARGAALTPEEVEVFFQVVKRAEDACATWYPSMVLTEEATVQRLARGALVEIIAERGFEGIGGSRVYDAEKAFMESKMICPGCGKFDWTPIPLDLPFADVGCRSCKRTIEIKDCHASHMRAGGHTAKLQVPVSLKTVETPRLIPERNLGVCVRVKTTRGTRWWFTSREAMISAIEHPHPTDPIIDSKSGNRKQVWVRAGKANP